MNKAVLIITGLSGSGKSNAGLFFQKKGIPVVAMGEVTYKVLNQKSLLITEANEAIVREELRSKFGSNIFAKKVTPEITNLLTKHKTVVIEGLRSIAEYVYFLKKSPKTRILFIEAEREVRYKRLMNRKEN